MQGKWWLLVTEEERQVKGRLLPFCCSLEEGWIIFSQHNHLKKVTIVNMTMVIRERQIPATGRRGPFWPLELAVTKMNDRAWWGWKVGKLLHFSAQLVGGKVGTRVGGWHNPHVIRGWWWSLYFWDSFSFGYQLLTALQAFHLVTKRKRDIKSLNASRLVWGTTGTLGVVVAESI